MKDAGKNSEPLDAILRRAMRERPDAPTPECADPESLAAYWDKSLGAAERERLEAHFADCMRCQMQLAAIARAAEPTIDATQASGIPWFRRWRVAIPALAAVAAVIVFVAMRRPVNEESRSDQLVAMAKHEAPAMDLYAKAPPLAPIAQGNVPVAPPPAQPSSELALNQAKTAQPPRAEAMSGTMTHRMADSAAASGARAMTAPAVAPGARAMLAEGGPAAAGNIRAHPVAGAAVAGAIGGPGSAIPSDASASAAGALVTISPPDRSVTWIIGKNGMIRRQEADGETHIQRSSVSTDLIAGAAPSATVCWIVGRSGTIIRTTDGEHWTLVASPTADNLVAVSASSANDATITTASGQSFATSDGGSSWHPQ